MAFIKRSVSLASTCSFRQAKGYPAFFFANGNGFQLAVRRQALGKLGNAFGKVFFLNLPTQTRLIFISVSLRHFLQSYLQCALNACTQHNNGNGVANFLFCKFGAQFRHGFYFSAVKG